MRILLLLLWLFVLLSFFLSARCLHCLDPDPFSPCFLPSYALILPPSPCPPPTGTIYVGCDAISIQTKQCHIPGLATHPWLVEDATAAPFEDAFEHGMACSGNSIRADGMPRFNLSVGACVAKCLATSGCNCVTVSNHPNARCELNTGTSVLADSTKRMPDRYGINNVECVPTSRSRAEDFRESSI